MILQRLKGKPGAVMCLGLAFLALANGSNLLLRRGRLLPENTVDLITGLLFGLAIPILLMSVVLRRSSPPRR